MNILMRNSVGTLKNIKLYIICLLYLLAIPISGKSQEIEGTIEDYYNAFIDVEAPLGFLFNLGFTEEDPPSLCFDQYTNPPYSCTVFTDNFLWRIWYEKLRSSERRIPKQLPELYSLNLPSGINNEHVGLGLIYMNGNYILPDSLEAYADTINQYVAPEVPTRVVDVFAFSPLRGVVYSQSVTFELDTNLVFSNKKEEIQEMEINFGNGQGFHSYPLGNHSINVDYQNTGIKNITLKLYTPEDTLVCYSKLTIKNKDCFNPDKKGVLTVPLQNGSVTSAEYSILYGCDNRFNRPIILVEGFDPEQNRAVGKTCDKYEGLWDMAKERGYDLVVIKFTNNNDFIQNNAQLVRALLNMINTTKEDHYENIIIGESMGGLITRIALTQMEAAGENHQVGLYTSFDSPHKGANTPLSLQELAEDFLDINIVEKLYPVVGSILDFFNLFSLGPESKFGDNWKGIPDLIEDLYNSPAARQMLIRHRDFKHVLNPDNIAFVQFMETLGFPNLCRNVALINGGKNGNWQENDDGFVDTDGYFLNTSQGILKGALKGTIWAKVSPTNVNNVPISRIKIKVLWIIRVTNKWGHASFFSKAYDIAPGGFNGKGDIKFSFVPVFSSIALTDSILNNPGSLFLLNESSGISLQSKRALVANGWTPFDDIYAGEENTKHVNLSSIADLFNIYCTQELMMDSLFLQNNVLHNGVKKDFYATNKVELGEDVNPWQDKIIKSGEFRMEEGSQVNISSGGAIHLTSGFSAKEGASLRAYIQPISVDCLPFEESRQLEKEMFTNRYIPSPVIAIKKNTVNNSVECSIINRVSNAEKENFEWLLEGDGIVEKSNDAVFKTSNLPPGQYAITCSMYGGHRVQTEIFAVHPALKDNELFTNGDNDLLESAITVYPNPAKNTISCLIKEPVLTKVHLELFNNIGISLFEKTFNTADLQKFQTELNVNSVPDGAYYLMLTYNGKREVKWVVIQGGNK